MFSAKRTANFSDPLRCATTLITQAHRRRESTSHSDSSLHVRSLRTLLLLNLREDVRVLEEVVLLGLKTASSVQAAKQEHLGHTHLLSNLDRVASPARQQYAVTRLHLRRNDVAVLVRRARANRDNGRLRQRRAGRRRGQEDTGGSFLRERFESASYVGSIGANYTTYCLGLEPLNENTVKQGHNGLDGLERRLSSL